MKFMLNNRNYSEVHPEVLTDSGRGKRVANQILNVLSMAGANCSHEKRKCLDIGASSGTISRYLADHFESVSCLDVDRSALAAGSSKYRSLENLDFTLYDGTQIPYADKTFDAVVFRRAYSCCPYYDQAVLAQEISRILKPNGFCYFEGHNLLFPIEPDYGVPLLHWLPSSWVRLALTLSGSPGYFFGRYRTFWGLRRMFQHLGFEVQPFTHCIIKAPRDYGFERLEPFGWIGRAVPLQALVLAEPVLPIFIWVLRKPHA